MAEQKKGGFVKPKPSPEKEVEYIGSFAKVHVPEIDHEKGAVVWIERGKTVTVNGDLAKRLLEQTENWKAAEADAPKSKNKKPADAPAVDTEDE